MKIGWWFFIYQCSSIFFSTLVGKEFIEKESSFGMQMPGRKYQQGAALYRYGFNGKENDNDVKGQGNQQDYGARIYDPRLGKFLSVDPLIKQYSQLTPYQFASNTPIAAIDIDGKESGLYQGGAIGVSGTPMSNYFDNKKGRETWGKAMGIGIAVGGAIVVDIFVTKGRLTQFLYTSVFLGHLYHNGTSDPTEQRKRANDLTYDLVGFGTGFIFGKILGSTITILRGPTKEEVGYLFRGTTEGFEGSNANQRVSYTPTSSDPGVATIFSISASKNGKGILQIAFPKELGNVEYGANVMATVEKEVAVGMKPTDFTARASITITTEQARGILKDFGIKLPSKIPLSDITNVIESIPKLSQKQITEFYNKSLEIQKAILKP